MSNEHIHTIGQAIETVESRPTPDFWEAVSRNDATVTRYNWAWKLSENKYMSVACNVEPDKSTVSDGRRSLVILPQSTTLTWEGKVIELPIIGEHEVTFEDRAFHRETERPIEGLGNLLRSAIEVPLQV